MTTDQEWARELFERSRQGEEPVWIADHAAMMRSGQRRSRIRTLTASGSVVATAAVVAAVGIGVAGNTNGKSPEPAPGHGVPPATKTSAAVDPSKVLEYANFDAFSTKDDKGGADFFKKYYIAVSNTTARDTMQLLSSLDPTLAHIAKTSPVRDTRLVSDDDPMAQDMSNLNAVAVWTDSGMSAASLQTSQATTPVGTLSLSFLDSNMEGAPGQANCVADGAAATDMLNPVRTSGNGWTDTAQWSPCTTSSLPDGSVLQTSTKSYGSFFLASAARKFPGDGGEVVMTWANYTTIMAPPNNGVPGMAPDPKRVLSPNPVTVEKLATALSNSRLLPAITPEPITPPPATRLQASDFGTGWIFDAGGSHGMTGDLVVDDGCTNQQNPVASPQPVYSYTGTTPSGIGVTASAQVDVMKSGSGAGWMAALRQHGTGGCGQYSRDTMSSLPAGTGDDAFVENWYGQGEEAFFIRFGDDIMRVDVTTTDRKMPVFTQADKDWFAGLAAKSAARHGGKR